MRKLKHVLHYGLGMRPNPSSLWWRRLILIESILCVVLLPNGYKFALFCVNFWVVYFRSHNGSNLCWRVWVCYDNRRQTSTLNSSAVGTQGLDFSGTVLHGILLENWLIADIGSKGSTSHTTIKAPDDSAQFLSCHIFLEFDWSFQKPRTSLIRWIGTGDSYRRYRYDLWSRACETK